MKKSPIPVVIPVYNPPVMFSPFVEKLRDATDERIIIIDDGSHTSFASVFQKLGKLSNVTLISHEKNKGKGAALKTAMHHVMQHEPQALGIITADADGQHVPVDIVSCDLIARKASEALIVGTRVARKNMPLRSRTGNAVTRSFLQLLHRVHVGDTQSGLRYIPQVLMEQCIASVFDKYDFELDMLIRAAQVKLPIVEFPIETIYLNNNKASHYKVWKDSYYVARVFVHHLGRPFTPLQAR